MKRDNLYYTVLIMLHSKYAPRVRYDFIPPLHTNLLKTALTTASSESKHAVADLCVNIIVGDSDRSVWDLLHAKDIAGYFIENVHLKKYLLPHLSRLENYICDESNLRMWAEHIRGDSIRVEEERSDPATPISLITLAEDLGSQRTTAARNFLRTNARDPLLRSRMGSPDP